MDTNFGDNAALFSALIGFLLPSIQAVLNRKSWSPEIKGAVAIATSIIAGAGTAYFSGLWEPGDILRSIMIVLLVSQVMYQNFYKPSKIAPAIEEATP